MVLFYHNNLKRKNLFGEVSCGLKLQVTPRYKEVVVVVVVC